MQSNLQIFNKKIFLLLSSPKFQFLIRLMLMMFLMVLWRQVFAGDNDDPFKGTEGGLVAAMNTGGSIRIFTWMAEGIAGATILIASRNLIKAFMGVVAIEILLRMIFKLAGV